MTEQMYMFRCSDVRDRAFEYRRGELTPDDHKLMKAHIDSCAASNDYVERIDGMLSSTKSHDFAVDLDRNAIFDKIMARVESEGDEATQQNVIALPKTETETQVVANDNRAKRYITGAVILAAGILIGVFIPQLLTSPVDELPKEFATKETPEEHKEVVPELMDDKPEVLANLENIILQPSPEHASNITVYGDEDAEWKVDGKVNQKMALRSGTVLVEFVPSQKNATFVLETDGYKVDVIGTVFYASKSKKVVGVVTGKVNVTPENGDPVTLERGQEFVIGEGVRDVPKATISHAEKRVDVESHQEKLANVKAAPIKKITKYSPEVVETPRRKLRASAEAALRDGRYAVAAEFYERMVEEFPATDPENASLRLDLARIYIKYLKQPRRAVRHLKRFTIDRPNDAATPTARDEMCRISQQLGTIEPQCVD